MECLVCGRETKVYTYICNDCRSLLEEKPERVVRDFMYVDEVHSCYYYNPFLKELILTYKFSNKRYLSKVLSELLIEKIFKEGLHKKTDLLVSVPIHKETLIKRGFNQIDLLLDEIQKELGLSISKDNLIKERLTKEQAKLSEIDRYKNLKNSFKVLDKELLKDKTILLVDDMITTGSTVEECAKVLKENQANKVVVLTIATSN